MNTLLPFLRVAACLLISMITIHLSAQEMHDAVKKGDINKFRQLLNSGADINETNRQGETVLSLACTKGRREMVEILLNSGADPNQKLVYPNKLESYPIVAASVRGHIEIVRLLYEHGANVNAVGSNGVTALHFAAMEGHLGTVKVLIELDADINAKWIDPEMDRNDTPIGTAISYGNPDIVLFLQKHQGIAHISKGTITSLQYQLSYLGYDPGPKDGLWGGKTKQALNKFLADNGKEPISRLSERVINDFSSNTRIPFAPGIHTVKSHTRISFIDLYYQFHWKPKGLIDTQVAVAGAPECVLANINIDFPLCQIPNGKGTKLHDRAMIRIPIQSPNKAIIGKFWFGTLEIEGCLRILDYGILLSAGSKARFMNYYD